MVTTNLKKKPVKLGSKMNKLRVLMLEDRQADADLTLYELRRSGFDIDAERVDNEADFIKALEREFDAIIADYNLPQFTGMRALELVQERHLDTPFILLSGTIGEEAAVDVMRAGAADYIMKDRRERLALAITRAMEQTQLRRDNARADASLRESEARRAAIFESALGAIVTMDREGKIVDFNRAAEKMFGYHREQAIGKLMAELIVPSALRQSHYKGFKRYLETGIGAYIDRTIEKTALRADGTEFPIQLTITRVDLEGGMLFTGSILDITERKRAEEALKLFRSLIDRSNDAIEVVDPATARFIDGNEKAWSSLGYTREEFLTLSVPDIDPTIDAATFAMNVKEVERSGSLIAERVHRRKDGSTFPIEVNVKFVQLDRPYIVTVARDITERKKDEEALKLFRALIDRSNDAIEVLDPTTGRFIDGNEKAWSSLGYTREEFLQLSFLDIDPTLDPAAVAASLPELKKSGSMTIQGIHQRKDGSNFPVEVNLRYVEMDRPYILSIARDITERKQAEQALRDSEQRFRALIENSSDAIGLSNADGTISYASPAVQEIIGVAPERLIGKNTFATVHPDDLENAQKLFNYLLQNPGAAGTGQFRIRHKDGSWRWIEGIAHNLLEDPNVRAMVANYRDITKRKQAEESLARQRELYDKLLQSQSDLGDGAVLVENQRFIYANDAFSTMCGYSQAELLEIPSPMDILEPERETRASEQQPTTSQPLHQNKEAVLIHKDGHRVQIEYAYKTIRFGDREQIFGIVRDITERKRAEQELIDSEQRFRALIENSSDAITLVDAQGKVVYVSPSTRQVTGYTPEERNGRDGFDFIHPDDLEHLRKRFAELLQMPKGVVADQYRLRHKDGSWHWIDALATNLLDAAGVHAIVINYQDITERKRAELEILRQNEELAALYDTARELTAETDLAALLQTIIERATALLAAPGSTMYLYHVEQGYLEVAVTKNSDALIGTRLLLGEGMAGRVAQTREPMIVDDYRNWEGRSPKFEGQHFSAVVQVPMLYRGELLGVLTVREGEDSTRKFTEKDVRLLSLLASLAASAVRNARLLEQTQRRADEFAILYQTSRDLMGLKDLPSLLETTVERAVRLLEATGGFIYLYDGTLNEFELKFTNGPDLPRPPVLKIGEGIVGRAGESKQAVIVADYQTWEHRREPFAKAGYRSIVAVPMIFAGEMVGALGLNEVGESTRQFTEADTRLLSLFAGQAASAVHSARLLEQTRRRADEFATLYQASRELTAQAELPALFQTTVERAVKLLDAAGGFIYLYQTDRNELELALMEGPILPRRRVLKMGQGIAGRVAESKEPIIVPDYQTWEHRRPEYTQAGYRATLEVPMTFGGTLIGVLGVNEIGESTRQFTENDSRLLSLFAAQAASAVHNARLLKESQARANEFANLYQTTRDLTTQYDLQVLLQTLVERAVGLLQTSNGEMYLYDAQRGDLELIVNQNGKVPPGARTKLGEGMAGQVAQTREPLVIDDYLTWDGRMPRYEGMPVRAVIQVPMLYGGELIGVLSVAEYGDSTRKFDEREVRLLSLFAAQAASAVHNARLVEQTQRRADEFAALYDVSKDIATQQQDISALTKTIANRATSLVGASGGTIGIFDPARQEVEIVVAEELLVTLGVRLKLGEGVVGRVAASREPLIVEDYRTWEHRLARYEETQPISAIAAVPMLYRGDLIGVLTVHQGDPAAKKFTAADVRLLSLLANQAASAIQNARLFEETSKRAEQLSTVSEIGKAVSAQLQLDQVLDVIYQQVQHIMPLDAFYIALYDAEKNEISYPLFYDEGKRYAEASGAPLEGTRLIQTLRSGEPLLFNRDREKPQVEENETMRGNRQKASASFLFAPLKLGARVIGVASAQSYTFNAYSEEHLTLLNGIANQAAIAIENARLFQDTQRHLQRVEALHEIDNAITGSLDLRVTFNVFLDQIVSQLGVDATDVLLLNPHTQMLEYVSGRGFKTPALQHTQLRVGDGLAGRAALDRKILALDNFARDIDGMSRSPFIQSEGFVSYYGVPLIAKGRVNGVLEIFHRTPLEPTKDWLAFLDTLASQAAIAIDNSEMYNNLQRANIHLALAYDTTLEGWSRALDLRDRETEGHTLRVTEITMRLARVMGMLEEELVHVRRGALLHDMGKMGIPDAILLKPGPLTDEEWTVMRKHPTLAYELLSPIEFLRPSLDIPYSHHEKWDGSGYPRGLKAEQIPLAARLFAVADVWDALRSDRPYRKAWDEVRVRKHILAGSGKHFDPKVVEVFLRTLNG